MESLRALTRPWLPLLLGYALTSLTSGCSTMQTWWSKESSVPPMAAPTPPTTAIQPAGATSIATAAVAADTGTSGTAGPFRSWAAVSPVNKLWSRETNRPVAEIATAWRNKVEYLPNPAAQGALQPGLAGQVFLYTAEARPAVANGRLIVDLIDETPRPPGVPPLTPERWEFKKDVLKALRTIDERFGECYVIFLPWPTYRPDVTHVRLRVRYEPEGGGFPIYAPETRLILGS
ncbi:MAG: hypothetical protein NZ703_00560, partial [Gemmataceae bacterium]|nr:hypothetical protein [Gemmataceae bacterium]